MRLWRRRQEPMSRSQAADQLYGDYVREPHRGPISEVAPRSAPVEAIKAANDEALAWELEALAPDTRRLVLSRIGSSAYVTTYR